MPGDAGKSFRLFAQSVADVGMAHVLSKAQTGRGQMRVSELRRVTGESDVLNHFMQQRGSSGYSAPNFIPITKLTTKFDPQADIKTTDKTTKIGFLKRLFSSHNAARD
jgi:hypothetical protein